MRSILKVLVFLLTLLACGRVLSPGTSSCLAQRRAYFTINYYETTVVPKVETIATVDYYGEEKTVQLSFLSGFGGELRIAPALAASGVRIVLSSEENALLEAFCAAVPSLIIPSPIPPEKDRPNGRLPRIRAVQVTDGTFSESFVDLDNLSWSDYPPLTERSAGELLGPKPWGNRQTWLALACFMQYHLQIEKMRAFDKIMDQSITVGGHPPKEALQREYRNGVTGVPISEVLQMVDTRDKLCHDLIRSNRNVIPYIKLLDIKERGFNSLLRLLQERK